MDEQIDNASSHGRVDNLSVVVRILRADADGKANVTELKKQIPLETKGIQRVDVGGVDMAVIRHRNNNHELSKNAYVAVHLGGVMIYEVFLAPPGGDAWWLDATLVEH